MNTLRTWYAGLQEREQRVVAIGSVVLVLMILIGGILMPLQSVLSSAVKGIETRRDDLAWMRLNAPEIRAVGNQLPADTGEAPVVLVDRVGREAGLASALRGTQPNAAGGVPIHLRGAQKAAGILNRLVRRNHNIPAKVAYVWRQNQSANHQAP